MTTEKRSAEASEYRRWYSTVRWRDLRKFQLEANPHCFYCRRMGRLTRATTVDHAVPHRGNALRFFNPENLISLCKPHHDATKQRIENGRNLVAVGDDGWPLE